MNPRVSSWRRLGRLAGGLALIGVGGLLAEGTLVRFVVPDGQLDSLALRLAVWGAALTSLGLGAWWLWRRPSAAPAPGRWRQRAALVAASTVVALVLAEGGLRLAGFQPWQAETAPPHVEPGGSLFVPHATRGYALRPGRYTVTLPSGLVFRAHHTEHARATSAADTSAAGGPTIWIFGCSWTYGWALDDAETFAWQLQERLPAHRVVNFGVPGYSNVQSLFHAREALAQLPPPDVLVLAYASFHDARNTFARSRRKLLSHGPSLAAARVPRARIGEAAPLRYAHVPLGYESLPLITRSALANLIDDAANALEERALQSREVSRRVVTTFAEEARRHGARFVLAGLTDDPTTAAMLAFAAEQGLPAVDVSVDLRQPGFVMPYYPHPSGRANARYAAALADFLAPYLAADSLASSQPSPPPR